MPLATPLATTRPGARPARPRHLTALLALAFALVLALAACGESNELSEIGGEGLGGEGEDSPGSGDAEEANVREEARVGAEGNPGDSDQGREGLEEVDGDADTRGFQDDDDGTPMDAINRRGILLVGVPFDRPPLGSFEGEAQEPSGFSVEIAEVLAENLFGEVTADNVGHIQVLPSTREGLLRDGEVDVVISTIPAQGATGGAQGDIAVAGPYLVDSLAPLTTPGGPTSVDALADRPVCVLADSNAAAALDEAGAQARVAVEADAVEECLAALDDGSVAAAVLSRYVVEGLAADADGAYVAGEGFGEERYGLAYFAPESQDDFLEFLNRALVQSFADGVWAQAWEDTIGEVVDEPVPEPPAVDPNPGTATSD